MQTIETFSNHLSTYLDQAQIQHVRRAYFYAEQAHDGQYRRSGEPYISHPLQVADILADMHMDPQSLMAAMLHDVIEDTGINKPALGEQFGEEVAELVDGVSKLKQIKFESQAEAQAENFQKMAMAMARDIRVILVKLADRLHNMRTIQALPNVKRRRIARETLDIYAPIAHRLGMHNIRIELENLAFHALYPMRARRIRSAVLAARGNRKEIVEKTRLALAACLERDGIEARVSGREKHLYSIYRKMREKHKSFVEIMDVYAYRIIVEDVDTCYRALGAVHNFYKPVPGRFKDYIAIPKANGYQSLHTSLLGRYGVPIEIQIRTREMEAMANNGIAAHWLYKSDDQQYHHERAREWVKSLLELQRNTGNSMEFIENVKIDLFPDEIYLFTPKGSILTLPRGSTPVDFAYSVHTDVGHACVACRINRRLAPLSQPLESGETVEIITAPGAKPNPGWLSFVVSSKARSSIRHYLKHQKQEEAERLGESLLTKALASLDRSFQTTSPGQIEAVAREFGADSGSHLYQEIGLGQRMAEVVARRMLPTIGHVETGEGPSILGIAGNESTIITCARCCHPIPGDHIVGHISSGRGLVVHREGCRNLGARDKEPDKYLHLRWEDDVTGEFSVELGIEAHQQRGLLAQIATAVTMTDANIDRISVAEQDARVCIVHLEVSVRSRIHLARVMKSIRKLKPVARISRSRN